MSRPRKDWYWPLGALSYASEIRDYYSEEAELIGIITMLWNRQELYLGRLFEDFLGVNNSEYAALIWNKQPTHHAKRTLLALAVELQSDKQKKVWLAWIIDHTKSVADRRNGLIHAEYVVHGRTNQLHAKVTAPNSGKAPKHQKATVKELQKLIEEMEELLSITEGLHATFLPVDLIGQLSEVANELRVAKKAREPATQTDEHPQGDYPSLSPRRNIGAPRKRPPV